MLHHGNLLGLYVVFVIIRGVEVEKPPMLMLKVSCALNRKKMCLVVVVVVGGGRGGETGQWTFKEVTV